MQQMALLRLSCCEGWHCLRQAATVSLVPARHNSNRAAVTKTNRNLYVRTYPTLLVHPDGSTITIRYPEPRKVIKLPLDLSTLSDVEKIGRLARRKPKPKIIIQEEIKDTFDASKYVFMNKKK